MNPNIRKKVLDKYNKKCAYCGKEILMDEMKIDHYVPKSKGGTDDLDNLLPACDICNHYKDSHNINKFKYLLLNIIKKIKKLYIVKVAMRYDLIEFKEFSEFYYERLSSDTIDNENHKP
jgi:5-methylcytosine-specific restriction endonuclease McrA